MTTGTLWRNGGGLSTSKRSDWATPKRFFEILNREFDFALDVCATSDTALAPHFFHLDEDSLSKDWGAIAAGRSIWMNPPYGKRVGYWIEKAFRESRHAVIVCLLPARTDTSWFHNYCLKGEIRFIRGRLCFDDNPRKQAPFPSMIVIFRPPNLQRADTPGRHETDELSTTGNSTTEVLI
jgi:phage N-6-adenine-methyltransferase